MKRHLRLLAAPFALVLAIILQGCSGNDSMISDLLSAVPAKSGFVCAMRPAEMIKKAGLKKSGDGYEVPDKLLMQCSDSQRRFIRKACSGDAGVNAEAIVAFIEDKTVYLTGEVKDKDAFRKEVTALFDKPEARFAEQDGVETFENVAMADGRFWVFDTQAADAAAVKRFLALDEKESYASRPAAKRLAECKDMAVAIGIDWLTAQMAPAARMGLAFVVDNPQTLVVETEFKDGLVDTGWALLDSKGEEASMLLPMDKIDAGVLRTLRSASTCVVAVSMPSKLVVKLASLMRDYGLMLPGAQGTPEMLTAIDGTVAIGASGPLLNLNGAGSISLAITLKGKEAGSVASALETMLKATSSGNVTASLEGNVFTALKGTPDSGTPALEGRYPELDGASLGVLVDLRDVTGMAAGVVDCLALRLDAGGKAKGSLKVFMTAKNRNALASISGAMTR